MANPTSLTQAQFNAKTENGISNVNQSGSIANVNITLDGQDSAITNDVILTIVANGTVSLTESSSLNLSISGIDSRQPLATTYWEYDMGLNPTSNRWTLTVNGPGNNNTLTFTKAKVNEDQKLQPTY